jgi:DNA anti-recombination protein RmuC
VNLTVAVVNAVVVGTVGLILAWVSKGRFEAIDRRFDAQDQRMDRMEARFEERFDGQDQRIARLGERFEERLESRFNTLQASIDALRSDLTRVALAVGVRDASAT